MIIAVDFDGTCVDHRFPGVGPDAPGAVETLRALVARGDKLILWTMRSDSGVDGQDYLVDAVKWFGHRGIPLWGVQRNPEQGSWTSSPKAYAEIYIDDAALGCPLTAVGGFKRPCVDWRRVAEILHVEKSEPTVPEMVEALNDIQDEREAYGDKDVMIFLNGKEGPSFRCPCGGNVFKKHPVVLKYRCNSCGSIFEGE